MAQLPDYEFVMFHNALKYLVQSIAGIQAKTFVLQQKNTFKGIF
jgi:hypothetical protein